MKHHYKTDTECKPCVSVPRLLSSAMLDNVLARLSISSVVAFGLVALVARLLHNKYATGLNHIPGPFLASFTDFYRLTIARNYRPERWHIELHNQYGDFVRIGPRTVLCSSNKAAKKIYALNAGFVKVRIVLTWQSLTNFMNSLISIPCNKLWQKGCR